jgi:serine protease Do
MSVLAMKSPLVFAAFVTSLSLFSLVPSAHAISTVQLKNGARLDAEVISEKADRLVVDLGFTVLTVPRDEIESVKPRTEPGASEPVMETATADLYRVAVGLPTLSVKENVDRVGESVVLVRTPVGLGSGFLIHPSGYIVTNEHVIAGEYNITVTQFRRGATELEKVQYNKVRIVALDSRLDLALLKIEDASPAPFPTVSLGGDASLNDGQTVFAIGSPLGLDRTVSQGIISSHARLLDGQLYIQTTTQINPGNSGGPMFNLRGEVVGVNNMKAMEVGVEGLNFAIPIDVLKNFLRNRDAYAFDPRNPNAGYRYLPPPQPVKANGTAAKPADKTAAHAKP